MTDGHDIEPATANPSAFDLAPRDLPTAPTRQRGSWLAILLIVGVLVAGGVIVSKFLTNAVDYYCNVDEIGSRQGCDADRRLRVQGVVEEGSVTSHGAETDFVIEFNGVEMPVSYDGEPGGIFRECLPVVVHGQLDSTSGVFEGDRLEVKHSDNYVADNDDRIDQADQLSDACAAGDADA